MVEPISAGSAPNRRCQRASVSITARAWAGSSSSGVNVRPCAAPTPSSGSAAPETRAACSRSGSPRPVSVASQGAKPTTCTVRACDCVSARLGSEKNALARSVRADQIQTSRSGSANGSGRSNTVSTRANTAHALPMPAARTRMQTAANPGRRRRLRAADCSSSNGDMRVCLIQLYHMRINCHRLR